MTHILADSYESDLTDEESEQLLLMSEHAIAPPLSPAAQAVLAAYRDAPLQDGATAAAVLKAAAEQIENLYCENLVIDDSDGAVFVLRQLMLIADEIEDL